MVTIQTTGCLDQLPNVVCNCKNKLYFALKPFQLRIFSVAS